MRRVMLLIAALALAQPCTSPASPTEVMSPPDPHDAGCNLAPEPTASRGPLVLQRVKIIKWHEMKSRLNAYQNPQAGWTYLVLVSAFSLHAKSSSEVVSVGHGKQSTELHAVKWCLATSWCWKSKHRPEFVSLLALFTVVGETKFAGRGHIWLYWASWK